MNGAFNSEAVSVFLAVLDSGSFSAAARQLGRVPSAISMAMANLEAELALELFDRRGREPKPTAVALALEPQARLLISQLQQLNTQALALSMGLEARLTLVIAPELQSTAWVAPLGTLAQEYPQLEVKIITAPQTDALTLLHQGQAQLALVFERPAADGRENFQEVGQETLLAVISPQHPLIKSLGDGPDNHPRLDHSQLRPERQILVSSRNSNGASDEERHNNFHLLSDHRWRVDSPDLALQLVLAQQGWAWLPQTLVQPYLNGRLLCELPFANLSNGETLWIDLVWSRERPLGLGARRFVNLMAQQYQQGQGAPHPSLKN